MINPTNKYRYLAIAFFFIGVGGLVVGIFADNLGLKKPGSLGIRQIYCILAGLGSLFTAWIIYLLSGSQKKMDLQKLIGVYKSVALITFNTILFLMLLEGIFWILEINHVMKYGATNSPLRNLEVRYIHPSESDGGETYRYYPFVIFRHAPYASQRTNINEEGLRVTPGAQCTKDAYNVYVFGGSTVYGAYVADNETLTYYLQQQLAPMIKKDVCVVNFGANFWVSTQGVIMLLRELQNNRVPDLVIFYDGYNDSKLAEENYPYSEGIRKLIEDSEKARHPAITWVTSLQIYKWLEGFYKQKLKGEKEKAPKSSGELAQLVLSRYLANVKTVKGMAKEYGFKSFFVWQPLSENYLGRPVFKEVYSAMRTISSHNKDIFWLGDLLRQADLSIFTGDLVHLKSKGNAIVAKEITHELLSQGILNSRDTHHS